MEQPKVASTERLVFDIGMCDGADTAYYLWKGYRVIAVEADPVMSEKAEERFATHIASGQLILLNIGISSDPGSLTFYRSRKDPGLSTLVPPVSGNEGNFESIEIQCKPLSHLIQDYGVPYYIKIDIEGYDEIALSSLTAITCPKYISAELSHAEGVLDRLHTLGYTGYKLINQAFHTNSIEILSHETLYRAMRKAGRIFPLCRRVIKGLPSRLRPRIEWDSPYRPDGWDPKGGKSSGPFGEDAFGDWRTLEETKYTFEQVRANGIEMWWDVHARRSDL